MTVEIEIKGTDAANEIYDLRNFIQEAGIEGLQTQLKQQPAIDGTMSLTAIAGIVAHIAGEMFLKAGMEITLEKPVKKLEHAVKAWLQKRKKEGKDDIEVYTEIQDGQSGKTFVTDSTGLTTQLSNLNFAMDARRTKVLLIGNSEFDFNFPVIKPVKGNLEDFYNILTDKKIVGIPPENITVAFNKTSGEIEEQLLLISKLPDVETLIIYYAGHGYKADAKKLFLVAKNSKKIDDHIISAVDFDFIKNVILKHSVASQKIVILDACHSGIATQGADDFLANFDVKGTYIFTSSSGDEVSYFNTEKRNTFFTGEMINVLNNGLENYQQSITLKDIYEAVAGNLKEKNFPEPRQKSELNIPLSNFSLARNLKFSVDKWKQKAKHLFDLGRMDEAEQEYNRLLMQYPDDEALRAEIAQNKIDRDYLLLVSHAEDHFQEQEYEKAIEKYGEALKIKQEFSVLSRKNKCEEYLELKRKILAKNQGPLDTTVIKSKPENKTVNPANKTGEPAINTRQQGSDTQTTFSNKAVHDVQPSTKWYWAMLIHFVLFGFGVFYLNARSKRRWLYPACIFGAGLIALLGNNDFRVVQKDEFYIFRTVFFTGLVIGYIGGLIECIIEIAGKPTAEKSIPVTQVRTDAGKPTAWIYVLSGIWLLLYFFTIIAISKVWDFFFDCRSCHKPFYLYTEIYVFLVLPALIIFLLLKRNKWGWILALIGSALKMSTTVLAATVTYDWYHGNAGITLALLMNMGVHVFLIYILTRAHVTTWFNISSSLKKQSVIVCCTLAVLQIIITLLSYNPH